MFHRHWSCHGNVMMPLPFFPALYFWVPYVFFFFFFFTNRLAASFMATFEQFLERFEIS